jgi:PAB-dependent poly(A)-specific ribonuclease subunit 3
LQYRRITIDPTKVIQNGTAPDAQVPFDPFQMAPLAQAMPTATQYNPYLEDTTNIASNGAAYYQPQTTFAAPAQPVSS